LIGANKIPAMKIGNQWRFHPARLETWFLNGGEAATDADHSWRPDLKTDEEFQIFSQTRTLIDLPVVSSEEALRKMIEVLAQTGHLLQPEIFYRAVREREEMSSTGIGNGVALPHAWHPINDLFRVPLTVSARLKTPIEFHAVDGKPVDLIFLLCAPRNRMHLKLLATFSSLAKNSLLLENLRSAPTPREFVSILAEHAAVAFEE